MPMVQSSERFEVAVMFRETTLKPCFVRAQMCVCVCVRVCVCVCVCARA
jgi:hypothetical protein